MPQHPKVLPSTLLSTPSLIQKPHPPLPTLHPLLDTALRGGIPATSLVQVFGPKSSGKTTLLLTLAASAVLEGNQAVLIDCCGSIIPARLIHILRARGASDSHLSQISICRVTSWQVLLGALVHLVPTARFLGIDGISFLFRSAADNAALKRLEVFAMRLQQKASEHGGIVMFANDVRLDAAGDEHTSMGESWRHVCATRLRLSKQGGTRTVQVVKSPFVGQVSHAFAISAAGFIKPPCDGDTSIYS